MDDPAVFGRLHEALVSDVQRGYVGHMTMAGPHHREDFLKAIGEQFRLEAGPEFIAGRISGGANPYGL